MATVNLDLVFDGNCKEAFDFYKSVFGGEYSYFGKYKDMPSHDSTQISTEDAEKIMHISLPISKETSLMGNHYIEYFGRTTVFGNNFSLSINTENKEEADRLYNTLSVDGTLGMPMEDTFWDAYFGMFTDKFGVNWMVSFEENQAK
ncbi:PhnB protein [Flavobacterium sp. CG_23.5]|uniref:VOC family protein n=1 Tax=unclassified Flavobacterium TaxID=196869 RepID=UPI0018CA80D0|nr:MULTISPECIES: VOC family protein [unclassified Flavobacterium]MBG6110745.1 PhnB protein [Flavobacterium sp. CG_9.10]MBP2282851.1 PhnB protein [Flavobacterium sp. CG_23.5]